MLITVRGSFKFLSFNLTDMVEFKAEEDSPLQAGLHPVINLPECPSTSIEQKAQFFKHFSRIELAFHPSHFVS